MFDYHLEHILSFTAKVGGTLEVIGELPEGLRANGYIVDGEVTGPKVAGKLRGRRRLAHCTKRRGRGPRCALDYGDRRRRTDLRDLQRDHRLG